MVLRAIKEVLGVRTPTILLRVGSSPPVEISEIIMFATPFCSPEKNIAEAQRNGIRPVNFQEIVQQFSKEQLETAVLFDTPPGGYLPGNHWRVLAIDDDTDSVKIQLCVPSGNYDLRIPPFTVSQHDILFTGVRFMRFTQKGHLLPLSQVVSLRKASDSGCPKDMQSNEQEVKTYWTNNRGKLTGKTKHPVFQKR
jgi:hypothetical protein